MTDDLSPALGLPFIMPSQAQKHVTHNEALSLLDATTQLSVEDAPFDTPPATPQRGQRYLISDGATGAWAGHDNEITVYDGTGWLFVVPQTGWRADVKLTGETLRFDGTDWTALQPDLQNLDSVGIGTTADSVNRLSVAAEASLLSHDGAGHQLKMNKAGINDTASLLFQTSWSGRAEMGTTGSDDFAVKVSGDGAQWKTAMQVDAGTGGVQFPQGQSYFDDVFVLDDTSHSFVIPWSNPARIMMWLAVNITGFHYLFSITGSMVGAQNFAPMFVNPAGTLNFYTGPLDGTTGTDGAINLSIENDNGTRRMYVENRIGSNRVFTMATLGR